MPYCSQCWAIVRKPYDQKRYKEQREHILAQHRAWRKANPDKVQARRKAYKETQRVHVRRWKLAQKYGLSVEQFEKLLKQQQGRCPICRRELTASAQVDHDHDTQAVRGLLCGTCNRGLGQFGDDPVRLAAAIDYLNQIKT